MNPFSALSWLWKALRLNSVTFAALFAFGILGLSVTRVLQNVLGAAGVPFLGLLLLPILLIGMIAKKERKWIPDEAERKRWARRLVFGAIALAVLIALVFPRRPDPAPGESGEKAIEPLRHRGPSGK